MCGRFASWADKNTILKHYGLQDGPEVLSGYNIVPSTEIPVVRLDKQGERELANCRWGLIPHWAKDTKLQPANARADGVASKPYFRDAFRHRRCLIPANGYYEWSEQHSRKQPWFIHRKDDDILSFAGIWSHWEGPDRLIESCALITTEPNPDLARIHDRMPVILKPTQYQTWLTDGGEALLKPYAGDELEAWPVSTRVNNPRNQGRELIERVAETL